VLLELDAPAGRGLQCSLNDTGRMMAGPALQFAGLVGIRKAFYIVISARRPYRVGACTSRSCHGRLIAACGYVWAKYAAIERSPHQWTLDMQQGGALGDELIRQWAATSEFRYRGMPRIHA